MCKQQPAAVVRGSAANAAAAVQWQPNRKPDQEPEKLPAEADRPVRPLHAVIHACCVRLLCKAAARA